MEFAEDSVFVGVWMPEHDSIPDGPKIQSMSRCQCGELWNKHRFSDGACPLPKAVPNNSGEKA